MNITFLVPTCKAIIISISFRKFVLLKQFHIAIVLGNI